MRSYAKFILICWLGANFCTALFINCYFQLSSLHESGRCFPEILPQLVVTDYIENLVRSIPIMIIFSLLTRLIFFMDFSRRIKITFLQITITLLIICFYGYFDLLEFNMIITGSIGWFMAAIILTHILVSALFIRYFGRKFLPVMPSDKLLEPEPPLPPIPATPAKKTYDLFD